MEKEKPPANDRRVVNPLDSPAVSVVFDPSDDPLELLRLSYARCPDYFGVNCEASLV